MYTVNTWTDAEAEGQAASVTDDIALIAVRSLHAASEHPSLPRSSREEQSDKFDSTPASRRGYARDEIILEKERREQEFLQAVALGSRPVSGGTFDAAASVRSVNGRYPMKHRRSLPPVPTFASTVQPPRMTSQSMRHHRPLPPVPLLDSAEGPPILPVHASMTRRMSLPAMTMYRSSGKFPPTPTQLYSSPRRNPGTPSQLSPKHHRPLPPPPMFESPGRHPTTPSQIRLSVQTSGESRFTILATVDDRLSSVVAPPTLISLCDPRDGNTSRLHGLTVRGHPGSGRRHERGLLALQTRPEGPIYGEVTPRMDEARANSEQKTPYMLLSRTRPTANTAVDEVLPTTILPPPPLPSRDYRTQPGHVGFELVDERNITHERRDEVVVYTAGPAGIGCPPPPPDEPVQHCLP